MTESVSVSGPVTIASSSREQVALDLMNRISQFESDQDRNRKYWITLYNQCHKATHGYEPSKILP